MPFQFFLVFVCNRVISCVNCEYFLWTGDFLNFCILNLGFLIYLLHVPVDLLCFAVKSHASTMPSENCN